MALSKRLEFLYDFVSGPSYLASTQVGKIARAHRTSVNRVLRANGLSSSSKI